MENWSVDKYRVSRGWPPSWAGDGRGAWLGVCRAGEAGLVGPPVFVNCSLGEAGVSGTGGGRSNGGIKSKAC